MTRLRSHTLFRRGRHEHFAHEKTTLKYVHIVNELVIRNDTPLEVRVDGSVVVSSVLNKLSEKGGF